MSLLQKETRTAFSGAAADGNISSGMFVCSCISYYITVTPISNCFYGIIVPIEGVFPLRACFLGAKTAF